MVLDLSDQYLVSLTWVTIARVSQGLVDNESMVLGLDNYVGYELTPTFR
jgi:hypothetical protein